MPNYTTLTDAIQFLSAAIAGAFQLAASDQLLTEVRRVLRDKFFWSDIEIADALSQLTECTTVVRPTEQLAVVVDDPDDDRILECAVAAGSDYIVSGDHHLLSLGSYRGIKIIRVADVLPNSWRFCRPEREAVAVRAATASDIIGGLRMI